jgi:hypothetical protein
MRRKTLKNTSMQDKLTNMENKIKYYVNQAVGFCIFLASIGVVQDPVQCVPLQMQYMMLKDAFGKWCTNKALSGSVPKGCSI